MLSMARTQDPNSAGSQFFICLANTPHLDGKYTIFGKVVEGLEVIHKIEKTPAQRERPVTPVYMTKVYMQPKS
jgi:peptidyl-prolyl cis-trans isomerase B (cyclophilin B)